MKRWVKLIIGGFILVIGIVLIATLSKKFFDSRKPEIKKNEIKVELSGDQVLNLDDQTPVDEKNIDKVTPYVFKVKNDGNTKEKYEMVFEDFASNDGKEHLDRTYLKYQLKSDIKIIKEGKLTNIKHNIIANDELDSKTNKKYELRIWVDPSIPASEWLGKSYSYSVFVRQERT